MANCASAIDVKHKIKNKIHHKKSAEPHVELLKIFCSL